MRYPSYNQSILCASRCDGSWDSIISFIWGNPWNLTGSITYISLHFCHICLVEIRFISVHTCLGSISIVSEEKTFLFYSQKEKMEIGFHFLISCKTGTCIQMNKTWKNFFSYIQQLDTPTSKVVQFYMQHVQKKICFPWNGLSFYICSNYISSFKRVFNKQNHSKRFVHSANFFRKKVLESEFLKLEWW